MPILDLETSVYPANLFEGYTQEASDRSWWVLYTKSRQEKAVARQLLTWTVPFYLPLVAHTNMIRGRKVTPTCLCSAGMSFYSATTRSECRASRRTAFLVCWT